MNNRTASWCGFAGAALFIITSILAGLHQDSYNPNIQLISEGMAVDTPFSTPLRYAGYLPAGILLTLFYFYCSRFFNRLPILTVGFIGMVIFYGISTIVAALFPCDAGCNPEFINPTMSQIIHNIVGALTYLFVPVCLLLLGIGFHQLKRRKLSVTAFTTAVISVCFLVLMMTPGTSYAGLYQRVVEGSFIVITVLLAFEIRCGKRVALK